MKVYISMPVIGVKTDIARFNETHAKSQIISSRNTPVSPLDAEADPNASPASLLGRNIRTLLECDAVYFSRGWENTKSCMAEYEVARIYGKIITFE